MAKEKVQIKYLEKEKRYIIDFRKHPDIETLRFNVFQELNSVYDFELFIDTSFGKYLNADIPNYYDLGNQDELKTVLKFLEEQGLRYEVQMKKGTVAKKVLGFAVGQSKTISQPRLGVYIGKKQLTKELFNYVMCTHDFTLGVGVMLDLDDVFKNFLEGEYTLVEFRNEKKDFNEVIVDSRMVERFITSMDLTSYIENK